MPVALDRALLGGPSTSPLERAVSALPYLQVVATISVFARAEAKRRANLRKHGIDFVEAERIFRGLTLHR